MAFPLHVACDVGGGKINTGMEFPRAPGSLSELVACIEALYTAEVQAHTGDPNRTFECIAVMKLVHIAGSERSQWVEVHDIGQIDRGAQLFVFDRNSPSPTKGPIPRAHFVVGEAQVQQLLGRTSNRVPAEGPSGDHRRADPRRASAGQSETSSRSASRPSPPAASAIPPEARDFLFNQLCRSSGGADVSAQRLHSIFVENGLMFTTDAFSFITGGRHHLSRSAWAQIADEFPPLIDALYDRIATRSVRHATTGELVIIDGRAAVTALKDELQQLEEEEHRLLLRQAAIKQRVAELQREIRREEERAERTPNASVDRAREWDMLQKFVTLKMRQAKLRDEDASISHQLSLL